MITGAKNDIKNNFKTVVLILGILTVTGPILNVIYGGDLFGAGCGEIRVKTSEVNAIVSARADTNSDINLYEDINIYNPGAIPIYIPELPDPGVSGLDEESSNQ